MRIELATAAFAPAFLLIGLRSGGAWWAWAFYALAVSGVVILVVGAVLVSTGEPGSYELIDIKDSSDQVLGYVGAYMVPVLLKPDSVLNAAIATATLFLIFLIHVAAGRVHVNPLLYLLGYRVYSATTSTASHILIARSEVAEWQGQRRLVNLASSILVEPAGRSK